MMAPGDLHIDLQKRSLAWLRSRTTKKGIRGGCEIYLRDRYVADAVALGNLQDKFNIQYWANHHNGPIFNNRHHERRYDKVFVFEAKATRADFLNTFGAPYRNHGNRFIPIGTHHWVVVAKGIAKPEEIERLEFWGVLEQSVGGLKEIRPPYWCNIEWADVLKIAHTILWK